MNALTESELSQHLAALPGWESDGTRIMKTYRFNSYLAGIAFAAAVGTIAEGRNHHPDQLIIGYKQVTVTFTTHDAGSVISEYDVQAAAAIEALGYPKA